MIDLNHPASWDTPLFPVAVVAQAALVPPATLRQWIVRYADELKLWEPKPAGLGAVLQGAKAESEGFGHRLSLRGALHIAAAARLISKGVPVKDAYAAAMHWAHVGSMERPGYFIGEPEPGVSRLPAGLFAAPQWTFLIHHRDDDARVVGVEPNGEDLPFKFTDLFAMGGPGYTPPTIVFLNMVDRQVRAVCDGYLRQ